MQAAGSQGVSKRSDPDRARRSIKRRATVVTHHDTSDHGVPGAPHDEQVGFGDLGQLVQSSADRPGTSHEELRVDPCQLALVLEQLL